MRRWLTILLLVLIPLQLTWAAAASYCQHESGAATKHFGHHEHRHQAKAGEPDQGKTKSLGTVDVDCSFCHACCAAIPAGKHDVPPLGIASLSVTSHLDGSVSAFPSRPERPNWAALA